MIHLPPPRFLQDEVDATVSNNNLDDDAGVKELVFFAENIKIKFVAFFTVSSGLGSMNTGCVSLG